MVRFKQYLNELTDHCLTEGKYPLWLRLSVGGIVLKIKNLQTKIENEEDPIEQNRLISQQNTLISYISGLGIGVGSTDNVLLNKLKSTITR